MRHSRKDYNANIQEVGPVLMALVAHLTTMASSITVGSEHEAPALLEEVKRWAEDQGIILEGLGWSPDEPVFILRAKDALAPDTVREWVDALEYGGGDPVVVDAVEEWADEMENWGAVRGSRLPDTPHELLGSDAQE